PVDRLLRGALLGVAAQLRHLAGDLLDRRARRLDRALAALPAVDLEDVVLLTADQRPALAHRGHLAGVSPLAVGPAQRREALLDRLGLRFHAPARPAR